MNIATVLIGIDSIDKHFTVLVVAEIFGKLFCEIVVFCV